ncbi:hypothetical protein HDU84_005751 [Entophlyctis sp. JEL0112]|nr:hypothetical protein HDU84_005751 [Entophlyctis sp. JEL0112]
MAPLPNYALSALLFGHSQDVRAVAAISDCDIVSASRDTKVFRWSRDPADARAFVQSSSYAGHSHFVSSLLYIPPAAVSSVEFPEGLIASGSADKSILVFEPSRENEPVFMLVGHTDNVCALALDPLSGAIISGSWDKTARIWINWECALTLTGHSQAVWAVMSAGELGYLTASADKLIKVWGKDGKCIRTLSGHTDAVRALAPLQDVGFLSAANDSTVRIWSYSGDCVAELSAHTSFVYGLAPLPDGGFASCGEDRTLRVWKSNGQEFSCTQTIQHPCTSVWCVATLPNGDIVTGGSDSVVRVFTTSNDRIGSADLIKGFDEEVAKQQIPSNQIGDVDKSKLPGPEVLDRPGRPGQVIMVRIGNIVEAHQFSVGEGWTKVGEVVDAVSSGRKQLYAGREYDYVFDIDIGAGANLKLPYNNSENPFVTAQRFIDENELSQDFLEQIANFIINNAKPTTIGSEVISDFVDPFTGAGRYIPGSSAPNRTPSALGETMFPGSYATFGAINCKGVKTKTAQLNSDSTKTGGVPLSAEEIGTINSLLDLIEAGKDRVSSAMDPRHWEAVTKIAFSWPETSRFPGIDLVRISVLYSTIPSVIEGDNLIPKLLHSAGLDARFEKVDGETNKMLGLRALANLVGTNEGKALLYKNRQTIVEILGYKWSTSSNSNLRLALATLLLKEMKDDSFSFDLLVIALEFLRHESDVENEHRALVAIGSLLKDNKVAQEALGLVDVKGTFKNSKNRGIEKIQQAHRAILKK